MTQSLSERSEFNIWFGFSRYNMKQHIKTHRNEPMTPEQRAMLLPKVRGSSGQRGRLPRSAPRLEIPPLPLDAAAVWRHVFYSDQDQHCNQLYRKKYSISNNFQTKKLFMNFIPNFLTLYEKQKHINQTETNAYLFQT